MKLLALGAIGTALIGAVSLAGIQAMFALANAPALFFEGKKTEGIVFSESTGQKLDIYTPERQPDQTFPVVVFFYGGSWQSGERTEYPFVGMTLVDEGFVAVVPDYRKYPAVRFPEFVEDGAEAVAWVQRNIGAYGGNPEQIHVMGHSAGAHITALLATEGRYLETAGAPDSIDSLIGLAGPYDFTPDTEPFIDMFGPPERYPQMQVPTFVDAGDPPMLLLHGDGDTTVGPHHTARLRKSVKDVNGCVETRFYPGTGHIGIMTGFTWVFRNDQPMVDDVVTWLKRRATGTAC